MPTLITLLCQVSSSSPSSMPRLEHCRFHNLSPQVSLLLTIQCNDLLEIFSRHESPMTSCLDTGSRVQCTKYEFSACTSDCERSTRMSDAPADKYQPVLRNPYSYLDYTWTRSRVNVNAASLQVRPVLELWQYFSQV